MAEDKKGFILYADQIDLFKQLTDEKAGQLIKHIFEYVNDKNPETNDLIINLAFTPIKQQLKRDLLKYTGAKEKKSLSGREGNLKRWNLDIYNQYKKGDINLKQAESIADSRKVSHSDKVRSHFIANIAVNDNVNDNVILLKKETKGPPDLKEFLEYASEKCEVLNYNYCEQKTKGKFLAWQENNWVNGNGRKIKNWKTSLLNALPHIQKEKGPAQKENGLDILREFNRRAKENEHLNNYE